MRPVLKLFCCVALLCSCNSVKHHKTITSSISDSSSHHSIDSGRVIKNIEQNTFQKDTASKSATSSNNTGELTVEFDTTGPASKQTITIQKKDDGSLIINPGGRKVKNLYVKEQLQATKVDSTGTIKKESTTASNLDSNYKKSIDSNHLVQQKKEEIKNLESHRVTIGLIVAGAIVVIVGIGLYFNSKKKLV